MKNRIIIFLILALTSVSVLQAQKLKVDRFVLDASDLSAQAKPRNDLNGELCALVKVQLASDKAEFSGDIVEPAPEYKMGEYWVYMTGKDPEASYLKVFVPGYLPLEIDFTKFKDVGPLKSGLTYILTIEKPAPTSASTPQPSAPVKDTQASVSESNLPLGRTNKSDDPETLSTSQASVQKVYENVEVMPSYPGGEAALNRDLYSQVQYPAAALEAGAQGKVIVQFVVTKTGNIGRVKVVRGCHPALDKEAVRVVKRLNKFNPGKHEGQPVDVWYSFPINFRLD